MGVNTQEFYNDGWSCLCCHWSWAWAGNVLRQALGQRGLQGCHGEQNSQQAGGCSRREPRHLCLCRRCDQPASLKAALNEVEQKLGEIHTVVYNAGNGVFATYENVTHEKLEMAMKTNVHGLLTVAQHLGPKMTARGEGVIAVTGATAALRGKPMTVGFATAKAAQRMLTQSLARDLGPKGVHCFYVIVDGGIGRQSGDKGLNESRMDPDAIAADYWHVAQQPKHNWTQELDCRPWVENW